MPAQVVFLRAVNVGGTSVFSVAQLAKDLGRYEVKNVGAAGTFVVKKAPPVATLKKEILGRIPLAKRPEVMIRPAKEILELVESDPFVKQEGRPFVTVLASEPSKLPPLPLDMPAGTLWDVRLLEVRGHYALHTLSDRAKPGTTANFEKVLGVSGTTRGWATILRVARELE
jgi:hypothetical protein